MKSLEFFLKEIIPKDHTTYKIVIASFGENPNSSRKLPNKIKSFPYSQDSIPLILSYIKENSEDHRNFYYSLALYDQNHPNGKKGTEAQIEKVLGVVLDFDYKDDPDSVNYKSRIPASLRPSFVIETSPNSFQVGFLFDELLDKEIVKPQIAKLVDQVKCDTASKDLSHVWRLPGLPNWPNKKKIEAGRNPKPFISKLLEGY